MVGEVGNFPRLHMLYTFLRRQKRFLIQFSKLAMCDIVKGFVKINNYHCNVDVVLAEAPLLATDNCRRMEHKDCEMGRRISCCKVS